MNEDIDFEIKMDEEEQPKAQQEQPDVDEDTIAIARLLKKAKEDPTTREVIASALGINQQQAQPQPVARDPREQELENKRRQLEELKAQLAQLPPDDPKRQEVLAQVVLLNTDIARLEPVVEVDRKMGLMQSAQAALTQLSNYAMQRLGSDPRYSRLTPEQKQAILMGVQDGLMKLFNTAPDQLLHPSAQQFVEMAIRNLAFEFLIPNAPADAGMNQKPPEGTIPRELIEQAKEDGIDPKILEQEIRSLVGGE